MIFAELLDPAQHAFNASGKMLRHAQVKGGAWQVFHARRPLAQNRKVKGVVGLELSKEGVPVEENIAEAAQDAPPFQKLPKILADFH